MSGRFNLWKVFPTISVEVTSLQAKAVSNQYYTDVEATVNPPKVFTLHQNYPNPVNPETKIVHEVPLSARVLSKIYDLLGNEVKTPGTHEVRGDVTNSAGQKIASGVYFYSSQVYSMRMCHFYEKMILAQINHNIAYFLA